MSLHTDIGLTAAYRNVCLTGSAELLVTSGTKRLARVVLTTVHSGCLTLSIELLRGPGTGRCGEATIYIDEKDELEQATFWSAFGTAYARAADGGYHMTQEQPAITEGDQVRLMDGHLAVVADVHTSRKTGEVVAYTVKRYIECAKEEVILEWGVSRL